MPLSLIIISSPSEITISLLNCFQGLVTFNGPYDRETESQIIAIIIARNDGDPVMSDTAEVSKNTLEF